MIPCPQWLPLASLAFFDLLCAICAATLNHTSRRYTYKAKQPIDSHRQGHSCTFRAQLALQHRCTPHGLPFIKIGLYEARWSASPLRPRLTCATTTPMRTALCPLQMPRRNVITALLMETLVEFALTCARGAFPEHCYGAARLSDGRVRRACALWGA